MSAVLGDDVFRFDPAIMVLIECQKRFVHGGEVARDLEADLGIEFLDACFYLLRELLLFQLSFRWLNGAFVDDGVLPCQRHVGEE